MTTATAARILIIGGPAHGEFGLKRESCLYLKWSPPELFRGDCNPLPIGSEFLAVRYTNRAYIKGQQRREFFICDNMPPAAALSRALQAFLGNDPEPYEVDPRYVCARCAIGGVRLWHDCSVRICGASISCTACRKHFYRPAAIDHEGNYRLAAEDRCLFEAWESLASNKEPLNWID